MKKIVIRVILILLLLGIIGLYAYDVYKHKTFVTDNLLKMIAAACTCIAALIRASSGGRISLSVYEKRFEDSVKTAFTDRSALRKKLLCAVRLYDENRFQKALKYLAHLKKEARKTDEHYAVNLFTALCFTDMHLYEHAEQIYMQLVQTRIADSRIFSNLGSVQMKQGAHEEAIKSYEYALDYDINNAFAHNNVAQAYFKLHEFKKAIPYAEGALAINPKMHQASALLAIIYALQSDTDLAEKYFHMAISSGRDPKELRDAIAYYRTAQTAVAEDTIEDEE